MLRAREHQTGERRRWKGLPWFYKPLQKWRNDSRADSECIWSPTGFVLQQHLNFRCSTSTDDNGADDSGGGTTAAQKKSVERKGEIICWIGFENNEALNCSHLDSKNIFSEKASLTEITLILHLLHNIYIYSRDCSQLPAWSLTHTVSEI